jgi:hypothetical protein
MKIKSAYKYQIFELTKPVIIYYIVIVALMVFTAIMALGFVSSSNIHFSGSFEGTVEGYSAATMIFLFVCGLNSFKQQFHMFLANGLSRRTLFVSVIAAFATASVAMALIDNLLGLACSWALINIPSSFTVEGIVVPIFSYMAAALAGIFIATAYYRMNKALKLIISIGVPVLLFIVLPIVDYSLFSGAITTGIYRFISAATSLLGADNPYSMALFNTFLMLIFSGLSWLLTRRATIKM